MSNKKPNTSPYVFIVGGIPEDDLTTFHVELSALSRKFRTAKFSWKEDGRVSRPQYPLPILEEKGAE